MEHHLITFPEITHEVHVDISQAMAYCMIHKHHNLFCYKLLSKPPLSPEGKLD
ncbi:hypothetical protein L873DRAFT_1809657 [Choiromyces venosus 120613-1]|uniref:Uncharacterized protein n=1 Tax=Choiromyces venosus 120613-1 TaxID=1336337 RepID=A0A3N4JH94_9PEZI|nr:hypothetical protein L873DRAFT_1809657 [Choiromyces venosus 120613-1]